MSEETKVKFAEKSYDEEALSVEFSFGNGETLTLSRSELGDTIWARAALHGLLQKIGDSYAGAKGDYTAAVTAAKGVIDQLKAGSWKAVGAGEGEAKPKTLELAEAMARIKGMPVADAQAKIAALAEDARKALRAHPQVKAVIAEIRAEKAKAALATATAAVPDLA